MNTEKLKSRLQENTKGGQWCAIYLGKSDKLNPTVAETHIGKRGNQVKGSHETTSRPVFVIRQQHKKIIHRQRQPALPIASYPA